MVLISNVQRFPSRESHGSASDDLAGTETQSDKNALLYYHRLGTQQCMLNANIIHPLNSLIFALAEDILVYKDESNPEWMWGTEITEVDGRYLLLSIRRDTSRVCFTISRQPSFSADALPPQKNLLWIADLHADSIGPNMRWNKVIDEFQANYE